MPATAPTPSGAGSAVGGANGGGAGGGGQEGDGRKGGIEGGGGYAGGVAGGLGGVGGRCENSYWVHSLGPAVSNSATSYQMASTCSCKTRSGAQLVCRHGLDSAHCFILRHLPTAASSGWTSKPTYTLRVAQTPPPSQLARQYVLSSPSIAFAGRPLLARGCIGGMYAPEQSDDGYTCSSRTVHGLPTPPAVAFDGRTRHAVGASPRIARCGATVCGSRRLAHGVCTKLHFLRLKNGWARLSAQRGAVWCAFGCSFRLGSEQYFNARGFVGAAPLFIRIGILFRERCDSDCLEALFRENMRCQSSLIFLSLVTLQTTYNPCHQFSAAQTLETVGSPICEARRCTYCGCRVAEEPQREQNDIRKSRPAPHHRC